MYFLYDVTAFAAVGSQATGTVSCRLLAEPQVNAVNPSTDLVFVTVGDLNATTPGSPFHFVDVKPAWGQHAHGLDPRVVPDQSRSWIVPPFAAGYELPEWVHPTLDGWTATAQALHEAITG